MEERNRLATGYFASNRNGSSASVHPYPAAGSPPNSQYNYQRNQPQPARSLSILDYVAVLVFLICITTVSVIIYLSGVEPPDFRVDSFSLSNFTLTNGSRLSFVSEIRLSARNPNGRVLYDHIVAGIYYKSMLLCQTGLAPFSQEKDNKTSLLATFAVDGNVVEKWVEDGINGEIAKNGIVEFGFRLGSWISSKFMWASRRGVLKVSCRDLAVATPRDGRPGGLTLRPGRCRVGIGDDYV